MNFIGYIITIGLMLFLGLILYVKVKKATIATLLSLLSYAFIDDLRIVLLISTATFAVGTIIQIFDEDKVKRGMAFGVLASCVLGATIFYCMHKIGWMDIQEMKEEFSAEYFVITLLIIFLNLFPFHRISKSLCTEKEIEDGKYIYSKESISKIGYYLKWSLILISPIIISLLIFGKETIDLAINDLFGTEAIGFKITFLYMYAIVYIIFEIPDYCEWKINSGIIPFLLMLPIGYYIYIFYEDYLNLNPPAHDNLVMTIAYGVEAFFNWIGSLLPEWFFYDGEAHLWAITRGIIAVIFISLAPGTAIAGIFYLIYELWHKKRDMCCTSYEIATATVLFPLYIIFTTYTLASISNYVNADLTNFLIIGINTITFICFACGRHRCPRCASSKLEVIDRGERDIDERVSGVERQYEERYENGRIITDKSETETRVTRIYSYTTYKCKRCGHTWKESHISEYTRRVKTDGYSKRHENLFSGSNSEFRN